MREFENKTVLVTGAGKNIGKDIALTFAKKGANVIVCDYIEKNALQTVEEVRECGAQAMEMVCDVRDRATVFSTIQEAIERFGSIDIIVNNAGGSAGMIGKLTNFVDAESDTLDFVIDVNLKGTMNCIQAALPNMIERKQGKIINIASIAGVAGIIKRVDYSAAKGGIIAMTKALAMEVGKYNIFVNCVSPGAIGRGGVVMKNATFLGEDGRGGVAKDITDAVLFFAQNEYITGQNLVVDGGRILGPLYQEKP